MGFFQFLVTHINFWKGSVCADLFAFGYFFQFAKMFQLTEKILQTWELLQKQKSALFLEETTQKLDKTWAALRIYDYKANKNNIKLTAVLQFFLGRYNCSSQRAQATPAKHRLENCGIFGAHRRHSLYLADHNSLESKLFYENYLCNLIFRWLQKKKYRKYFETVYIWLIETFYIWRRSIFIFSSEIWSQNIDNTSSETWCHSLFWFR